MSVCDTMRSVEVLYLIASVCITVSLCEDREERLVRIHQGLVRGYKDSKYDVFEFYGIPYASAPTGRHKFKAPLPAPVWTSTFEAVNKDITCPQVVVADYLGQNIVVQEDCLVANVLVPVTNETNLPVAVGVHGGGFQIGNGLFSTEKKILNKKNFILVTFNYRLGPHGFLCLGTEDVPGNAGLKDQIALLRWVNKNIKSFGGNPNDVTIWGVSAGSASVDLLMLSPLAKGLFNKVIPESGANLAAFAVQTDPIANAKEYAKKLNFSNVDDIYALEEFYMTTSIMTLAEDSIDRKDSSLLFSPCVERKTGQESFLDVSPFAILKSGNYEKVPILYGFTSMEGLLRINLFDTWRVSMNERFLDFIPRDLTFKDYNEKAAISKQIKEFYFGDGIVTENDVLAYIDYFTDVIFAYPTLRSIQFHVNAGHDQIYLYEYSYTYENDPISSPVIPYTNNVRGATHGAQSMILSDGPGLSKAYEDTLSAETKGVMTYMRELWTNFITSGNPVPAGSSLPAWPAVSQADRSPHMSLGRAPELRGPLLERRARFWDAIYEQHYRAPKPPPPPPARLISNYSAF